MKNGLPILVSIVLGVAGTSCYKNKGQIVETTTVFRSLSETNTKRRTLPDTKKLTLEASFENEILIVKATQAEKCVDETTKIYDRTDHVERKLPRRYHAYLATSLVLTGLGGTAIGLGAWSASKGTPGDVGSYEEEKSYDRRKVMTPTGLAVGGVLSSVGISMLISSIVDAAAAKDETVTGLRDVETEVSGEIPCNSWPAQNIQFTLSSEPKEITDSLQEIKVSTDSDGEARVPILRNDKVRNIRFSENFAVISCEKCDPLNVTLPPEVAASVVIAHNNMDEFKAWLRLYPQHKDTPRVRAALEKLAISKKREEAERQEELASACDDGYFDSCAKIKRLRDYYSKECGKRNMKACFSLGEMYRVGDEGEVDAQKALKLFVRACQRKLGAACTSLGQMWESGEGVQENGKKATAFYRKGCKYGDDVGCDILEQARTRREKEKELERQAEEKKRQEKEKEQQLAQYGIRVGGDPEHVGNFYVQQEGDGFFTYFTLLDEKRNFTVTGGWVDFKIEWIQNDYVQDVLYTVRYDISRDDFEIATTGLGRLGRTSLIFRTPFIRWSKLRNHIFILGESITDWMKKQSYRHKFRATITITTTSGHKMRASEEFRPR